MIDMTERKRAQEVIRQSEERYREIRRLNEGLEQRVQERTGALEREVAERKRMTAELKCRITVGISGILQVLVQNGGCWHNQQSLGTSNKKT